MLVGEACLNRSTATKVQFVHKMQLLWVFFKNNQGVCFSWLHTVISEAMNCNMNKKAMWS